MGRALCKDARWRTKETPLRKIRFGGCFCVSLFLFLHFLKAAVAVGALTGLPTSLSVPAAAQTITPLIPIILLPNRPPRFQLRCFMIRPVPCQMFQPITVRSRGLARRAADTSRNFTRIVLKLEDEMKRTRRYRSVFWEYPYFRCIFLSVLYFHGKSRADFKQRDRDRSWSTWLASVSPGWNGDHRDRLPSLHPRHHSVGELWYWNGIAPCSPCTSFLEGGWAGTCSDGNVPVWIFPVVRHLYADMYDCEGNSHKIRPFPNGKDEEGWSDKKLIFT